MKIFHILSLLGLNAIPALGWFFGDWTPATTLAVYWFENVVAALFIAMRIILHRWRRPRSGHIRYVGPGNKPTGASASYLANFLVPSLVFSAAHAFFLAILAFVFQEKMRLDFIFNWPDVKLGCAFTLGLLTLDFLLDLPGLKQKPFRWIELMGQKNLGRVIVVHLTIVLGMFATAFSEERGFFGVFIGLKTLLDISAMLPQWHPKTPPAWMCRIMDKLPSDPKHKGMTFVEFWQKDDEGEEKRQERNERPI